MRTGALPFARTPHPSPAADEEVARALASPGFGSIFTDHMVVIRWSSNRGWHEPTRLPYAPMTLDPATAVMHYGQAIFEGLKAYRQPDGSVAAFRPYANAARFRASAVRMAMPELPDELFVASLTELVGADEKWVPAHGEDSLYLRPFMIATSVGLGVNAPAAAFDYRLIASPAGSYFAGGARPVTVWISHEYVRAAPGGTGAAKCAGNYAAAFRAQGDAARHGCEQVVWLDALERRWVEELGGMNLFFVFGSGDDVRLVTPELIGTIVAGITRHSLLTLARDLGYAVEERRVSVEEWRSAAMSGALSEVFASGTAAAITPIGRVRSSDGEFLIGDGRHGEVTMRLRTALTGIQTGSGPDVHHWMYRLAPGADR